MLMIKKHNTYILYLLSSIFKIISVLNKRLYEQKKTKQDVDFAVEVVILLWEHVRWILNTNFNGPIA